MTRGQKIGTVVLGVGVAVLVLSLVAAKIFPQQWGGPNIGGGLLNIGAGIVSVVGLIVLIVATLRRKAS